MNTPCPNCGARLPASKPGESVTCSFCGTENVTPSAPEPARIDVHVHAPAGNPTALILVIGGSIGLLMMGGLAFFAISRPAPQAPVVQIELPSIPANVPVPPIPAVPPRPEVPAPPPTPTKPKLTLATLATTPFFGREPIEAPGMVGSLEAFDLVANIDWARSIARAWTRDAELHRLAVERCDREGLVNLRTMPEAEVMYRFLSRERIKEFDESTSVTKPKAEYELFVFVTKDGPMVQKIEGDPWAERDTKTFSSLPACTLSQSFAALDKANQLPVRPVYNADFYVASNRPAWKIETLNDNPRIPWVEGPRCRVDH